MRAVICRAWGEVDELQLPLEKRVEAIRLLTDRKAYGKVVVVPGLRAD